VQVQLTLAVVERLQERDFEGEGLLLGKAVGQVTEIHDFVAMSSAEPVSAAGMTAAIQASSATRAVGYYRITREPTLRLSETDLKLMEAHFPARHQVFLLIQRTESNPANATFFFWDEGRMCGDFPFLEFPLEAALLAAAERHRVETLHRKIAAQAETPDTEPAVNHGPRPWLRVTTRALFWGLAAALVVCLCLAGVVAARWLSEKYWPRLAAPGASPAAAREVYFGLQAERQNGDLKLTWNRESPVVLNATSGVLVIEDGGSSRKITLDPMQVRSGSILYAPATDQVQMQLSVLTTQGTISESVLVLLPRGSAPKLQIVAQRVVPASEAAETRPPFGDTQQTTPLKAFTAPPPIQPAPSSPQISGPPPPVRPAVTGTLPAGLTPRLAPATPPPVTAPKTTDATQPPASNTAAVPATNTPAQQPPAKPAGQPMYYGPEVASKVVPPFPPYLRSMVVKPTTVEISVSIDAAGKVVKAEPVTSGPPPLIAVAANAARLWRFKPARKGTEPIPSEMVLQFLFRPPQ
jgi:protein TonB